MQRLQTLAQPLQHAFLRDVLFFQRRFELRGFVFEFNLQLQPLLQLLVDTVPQRAAAHVLHHDVQPFAAVVHEAAVVRGDVGVAQHTLQLCFVHGVGAFVAHGAVRHVDLLHRNQHAVHSALRQQHLALRAPPQRLHNLKVVQAQLLAVQVVHGHAVPQPAPQRVADVRRQRRDDIVVGALHDARLSEGHLRLVAQHHHGHHLPWVGRHEPDATPFCAWIHTEGE